MVLSTTTAPHLVTLAIGMPKKMTYGNNKILETAICKAAVTEAYLTVDGFQGDGIADTKHHGGPDRAVCVYPQEHYARWKSEFGDTLPLSTFGENMTVTGMLEQDIHIGDVFQIGDAIIQVTQGRIPCSTISKRTGNNQLLKRFVETGYTGYLCRVLEEGKVRANSPIQLLQKDPHGISILYANEVYYHQPKNVEAMEKIVAVEALAEVWREQLTARLHKLQKRVN